MSRIEPLNPSLAGEEVVAAFEAHVQAYQAKITNMKRTLAHSLVSFEVYMHWYPLYKAVTKLVGSRAAYLYAFSISTASNCPLCATFFRKIIVDAGEDPGKLILNEEERSLLEFGSAIAKHQGHIADHVYRLVASRYTDAEVVLLIAFAGQMIATNVFNNVVETDIDEYLTDYLPPVKSIWKHVH